MKTALHFKVLLIVFILPAFIIAKNSSWKGKYTKEKTFHKEFNVNPNALLEIDNSYGNLDITTWNENKIVIDVIITTNGNNEDKVQRKLDGIDVDFSSSASVVSAKTRIKQNRSWMSWSNNNVNMKVNYIIKMPASNSVDLDNDYGEINLDKLDGRATINCDYGKITTKELMADNNNISFDYTKNSYFEYIKSGTINADYSGFTVGKSNDLKIEADYTDTHVEMAEDVTIDADYGSVKVDNANTIDGDFDYVSTRFGNIYKDIRVKADYGSLRIDNLTANAGDVNVESDYMKITIGFDPAYYFNFELDVEYASVNEDAALEVTKRVEKSREKYYAGYHGNSNSTNNIKISSDYGSVTLKKN